MEYKKIELTCFSVLLLLLFLPLSAQAQIEESPAATSQPEAILLEAGPYRNGEMASLHIDLLRNQISAAPGSRGVIFVYCGKDCRRGEIEANLRGIYLALKGKGIEGMPINYMLAGYRESFQLEYWLIPAGAAFPEPKSTISIADVPLKKKYPSKVRAYDCCDEVSWPPRH